MATASWKRASKIAQCVPSASRCGTSANSCSVCGAGYASGGGDGDEDVAAVVKAMRILGAMRVLRTVQVLVTMWALETMY